MTAYWPTNTDWGVEPRYFVVQRNDGTFAVEDADADFDAAPVAVFSDIKNARSLCRRLNGK